MQEPAYKLIPDYDVVIVGGGISGLATAWFLQQVEPSTKIALVERSNRLGGKVKTEQVSIPNIGEFVIEAGPDAFITMKPYAYQLAQALGLGDALMPANERKLPTYVLQEGKPVPLPEGLLMIIPTRFMPFARSSLISIKGKLRMALDWFIPPLESDQDETLAQFIRRRLGHEALDKLAEPLMSGIYNADAERQSLLATFPRFRQMECQHGSLIRGMLSSRRKAHLTTHAPQMPPFVSFEHGTQQLIDQLTDQLQIDMHLGTSVANIESCQGGGYAVRFDTGVTLQADSVVLATPAHVTAGLIRTVSPATSTMLKSIRYVSTGTLSLAFRTEDIPAQFDGVGIVIPKIECRAINAITISSRKFQGRVPTGYTLLRVYFGGTRSPESMILTDEMLLKVTTEELAAILGIQANPIFHRIYRWEQSNPQYDINHLILVQNIEQSLPAGLYVTGSAYQGIGLPDCIHQAEQTSQLVTAYINKIRNAHANQKPHPSASAGCC